MAVRVVAARLMECLVIGLAIVVNMASEQWGCSSGERLSNFRR
jgi:hypothetical protein